MIRFGQHAWDTPGARTPRSALDGAASLARSAVSTRKSTSVLLSPGADRSLAAATMLSVIIPARNEALAIAAVVRAVHASCPSGRDLEVIVVDDGSTDDTVAVATRSGARVLELGRTSSGGNPAKARNQAAAIAQGDPIVFLDADCLPAAGSRSGALRTSCTAGSGQVRSNRC